MGLGTSRLPITGPDDKSGLEEAVGIIVRAMELGINYIDTSYPYSAGMANTAIKEAFRQAGRTIDVTVKSMYGYDHTADDTFKRVEMQLSAMGIEKAKFFMCWTISEFATFEKIMAKGGIYEGAVKLKSEGLIDHITFSSHATPEATIEIIKSGAFDGIMVSYSMLNAGTVLPVLDAAQKHGVDVAVMNPLGGGIIPQNSDFFAFARNENETDTVSSALRFAVAHPAVKIVLTGPKSRNELEQNAAVFTQNDPENMQTRRERVIAHVKDLKGFCTGCKYCIDCPADIPIPEIMTKRNSLLFEAKEAYNRSDPEMVKKIRLFQGHYSLNSDTWFPKNNANPCTKCGMCEKICTQHLPIIDSLDEMYRLAGEVGFTLENQKKRVEDLVVGKGYTKVGLYPNGGFAMLFMERYQQFFGNPPFEWLVFNGDPKQHGQVFEGLEIFGPNDIERLQPDIIIVLAYKFDEEIFQSLSHYREKGVEIVKLHRENEVPWVY